MPQIFRLVMICAFTFAFVALTQALLGFAWDESFNVYITDALKGIATGQILDYSILGASLFVWFVIFPLLCLFYAKCLQSLPKPQQKPWRQPVQG